MDPFTILSSRGIPLLEPDVDTDQIIPAQLINVSGQPALADALFASLRRQSADFVLNRPEMAGRKVLIAGPNFGCGSSREAAAWALHAWGIRALIGPSFNATFHNNCLQNGLLPIVAPADSYLRLCEAIASWPALEVSIDLAHERVRVPAAAIEFPTGIEPFVRDLLLRGIDELQYLLDRRAQIDSHEKQQGALP
jgi:3-isopropylmalate/(R)-2-methylmalate dehydratase small subunit